ncbi:MAG: phenylacetate--CoA ligase family protein, partial [Prolixibacteraceae bacterium]|nr:phenylacetate--CoA ligase family protein [Prolixibacteraceae bacterium]
MSFGGFVRRKIYWSVDYFKGKPVRSHYNDLKFILNNYAEGAGRQHKHLQNLLNHAVENSAFYRKYKGLNFEEFPVMDKGLCKKHYNEIKIKAELVPFHRGNMHIESTSGSTGTPFSIPQDWRKRNRRIAELKYFGELAGFYSHEKLAQLRIWTDNIKKTKTQAYFQNIVPFDCENLTDESFSNLCGLIRNKKITALLGYPSWFDKFLIYLKKHNLKPTGIKTIITISEYLPGNIREDLRNILKCDVVSRYSNLEQGIFGQQPVSEDYFQLNHASYYFELLKPYSDEKAVTGETGRIVVTDLFNYAFPLIRYDTGDTGIKQVNSDCKNEFFVLSNILGRRADTIFDTKGNAKHPWVIHELFLKFPEIKQWQFIQKSKSEYLVILNSDYDYNF